MVVAAPWGARSRAAALDLLPAAVAASVSVLAGRRSATTVRTATRTRRGLQRRWVPLHFRHRSLPAGQRTVRGQCAWQWPGRPPRVHTQPHLAGRSTRTKTQRRRSWVPRALRRGMDGDQRGGAREIASDRAAAIAAPHVSDAGRGLHSKPALGVGCGAFSVTWVLAVREYFLKRNAKWRGGAQWARRRRTTLATRGPRACKHVSRPRWSPAITCNHTGARAPPRIHGAQLTHRWSADTMLGGAPRQHRAARADQHPCVRKGDLTHRHSHRSMAASMPLHTVALRSGSH